MRALSILSFVSVAWVGLSSIEAAPHAPASKSTSPPRKGASANPAWLKLLQTPRQSSKKLPKDWKVVSHPNSFEPRSGGPAHGGAGWTWPESVDGLVRDSTIVVVGTCAGNDGGFLCEFQAGGGVFRQYTTYYLRVEGYLKDFTGQRAAFLKLLAPGGFLNGGAAAGDGLPFPTFETGHRYLLYLTPNNGIAWGIRNAVLSPDTPKIGNGDEYWTTGWRHGRWSVDEKGRLRGAVFDPWQWEGLGYNLPLGEAISRVKSAVERERKHLAPLQPRLTTDRRVMSAEERARYLKHAREFRHAPR